HRTGIAHVLPRPFTYLVLDTTGTTRQRFTLPGITCVQLARLGEQSSRLGEQRRSLRVVRRGDATGAGERGSTPLQCVEEEGGTSRTHGSVDAHENQIDGVRGRSSDRLDRTEPTAMV